MVNPLILKRKKNLFVNLIMSNKYIRFYLLLIYLFITVPSLSYAAADANISSNPAAVNITPGTGAAQQYLEKQLGIQNDHGIHFDGAWLGDLNDLFAGGIPNADRWTSNSLLTLDLNADTEKLGAWKGGLLDIQYLQF